MTTRLEEIKARLAKITPGPWTIKFEFNIEDSKRRGTASCGGYQSTINPEQVHRENLANAAFIAAAPADIAALVAVVDRQLLHFPFRNGDVNHDRIQCRLCEMVWYDDDTPIHADTCPMSALTAETAVNSNKTA